MKRLEGRKRLAALLSMLLVFLILATLICAVPVAGLTSDNNGRPAGSVSTSSANITVDNKEHFLIVEFEGKETKVPVNSAGATTQNVEAPSLDGKHSIQIPSGTIIRRQDGNIVELVRINETQMPPIPDDKMAISKAYNIEPIGVSFSMPADLILSYDSERLPEGIESISLARYVADFQWIELQSASGIVAETGKVGSSIDCFATIAVLASRAPTSFKANNLKINLSSVKNWGVFAFMVRTGQDADITINVKNEGGQKGTYSGVLKLNGVEVEKKEIELEPGKISQLSFKLSEMAPGDYSVEIGGLSGTFKGFFWINWWLIAGLILGLVALSWLVRRNVLR